MSMADKQELAELEMLCIELGVGSLSAEQVARLEQLLLNNPTLQDVYCRLMTTDDLLRAEFGENGNAFSSLLSSLPCDATSRALSEHTVGELMSRSASAKNRTAPSTRRRWTFAALTASVLAMFALLSHQTARFWFVQSVPHPHPDLNSDSNFSGEVVLVRSQRAIDMLYRVTNADWESGTARPLRTPLDEELEHEISNRLIQGTAQLSSFNGQEAGGFVAVLPPGAVLDLRVFADSLGENALAVMELDEQGVPTGQLVSFSNQSSTQATEGSRLYGQLGTWSESNDTNSDKYFLFAGLQRLGQTKAASDWFVADFSVLVSRRDLLHIGWDDSGWTAHHEGEVRRDKDYNDLAATIRIHHPDAVMAKQHDSISTLPELDAVQAIDLDSDIVKAGYPFTLTPGQGVILTISSNARLPNSFAVVDRHTGIVWWQGECVSRDQSQMGAYLIENNSLEPLELVLVGRHKKLKLRTTDSETVESQATDKRQHEQQKDLHAVEPQAIDKWCISEYRVLVDDNRCQTIGFEDLGIDKDWNDLRVNMHWFSD